MENTYLLENFVNVKSGDPIRLFPFGVIHKGGKRREITPEFAKQFQLPHFKPPLKLGSHNDETPAGGFITGLEVRDDGLYALVEYNEKGEQAIKDGAYRYHSPEVLFDGELENPTTGAPIRGPLIIGDALLHTPHLGEAAALYSVEPLNKQESTMDETVTVPKSIWDKFTALFERAVNPPVEPEGVKPEEFDAAVKERDEYKAKLAAIQMEAEHKARVDNFASALKDTKASPELAALLADMPDENASRLLQELKALSAQIDESKLTGEIGSEGAGNATPDNALLSAVTAKMGEVKVDFNTALNLIRAENPDLVAKYAAM